LRVLAAVALLCAGFLAGTWLATDRQSAKMARLMERNAVLEARKHIVDTAYVSDTVTLTRTRTRTDSVLVTRTDTLMRVDSVRVLVEAERQACDAVIATCEVRVAVRDSQIAVLDSALVEARRVPRLSKYLYVATDLNRAVYGGVEARVRLFGVEGFGRYEVRADSLAGELRAGVLLRF
jgi:uncharacterized coiled-coil protein SlyX